MKPLVFSTEVEGPMPWRFKSCQSFTRGTGPNRDGMLCQGFEQATGAEPERRNPVGNGFCVVANRARDASVTSAPPSPTPSGSQSSSWGPVSI